MPDDLYDREFYTWTQQQARLLRAHAHQSDIPADWPHLIEEIEALGRDQIHAVQSNLIKAFSRIIAVAAWPSSRAVRGWKSEAMAALGSAQRRYRPSMRHKIDDKIFLEAAENAMLQDPIDSLTSLPVTISKVTLDDLLDPARDVAALADRLRS